LYVTLWRRGGQFLIPNADRPFVLMCSPEAMADVTPVNSKALAPAIGPYGTRTLCCVRRPGGRARSLTCRRRARRLLGRCWTAHAVVAGGFVFLSGQVALLPDGTFAGGSVEQQTVRAGRRRRRGGGRPGGGAHGGHLLLSRSPAGRGATQRQVITNLKTVLEEVGSSLRHVTKMTVYLKSMDDFAQMNKVYAEVRGQTTPAVAPRGRLADAQRSVRVSEGIRPSADAGGPYAGPVRRTAWRVAWRAAAGRLTSLGGRHGERGGVPARPSRSRGCPRTRWSRSTPLRW